MAVDSAGQQGSIPLGLVLVILSLSLPPLSLSLSLSLSLALSCSMGSMPVGVRDIFHKMAAFLSVHRQSVQGADNLVAPVH